MRRLMMTALAITSILLIGGLAGGADEKAERAEKVAKQKKKAEDIWGELTNNTPKVAETANMLIFGGNAMPEQRLKALGELLEKELVMMRGVMQMDAKEELCPGKLSVHLFA